MILGKKRIVIKEKDLGKGSTKFRDASGKRIHIGDEITVSYRGILCRAIVTRVSWISVFFKIIKGLSSKIEQWYYYNNKSNHHVWNLIGVEARTTTPEKRIQIINR